MCPSHMPRRREPRILFPLHQGSRTLEEFEAAVLAVLSEQEDPPIQSEREAPHAQENLEKEYIVGFAPDALPKMTAVR
jgi:hypothetical protein